MNTHCLRFQATEVKSPENPVVNVEHHVVYSESYSVPVMYFTATTDGKSIFI